MMKSLCFALTVAATAAACGDDGGGSGSVDAPSNVPAMITVSGTTSSIGFSGRSPAPGVMLQAFRNGESTAAATATSDGSGNFSMMTATNGVAFDGYILAKSDGNVDSYLYPPAPLAADYSGVTVLVMTSQIRDAAASLGGATQEAGKSFIAMEVFDPSSMPVKGATVSATPTGGVIRYNGADNAGKSTGLPENSNTGSTQDDGIAYVFDGPAGSTMVNASASGQTFHAHSIEARADVVTLTIVQ